MKKHIPNILTLFNLTLGLLGIIYALSGEYFIVFWLIVAAMIFDFLDGLFAKILKAQSEIGKQLDSLADMVSFGVVPGLLLFYLTSNTPACSCYIRLYMLPWLAFSVPLAAAWRLARFNTSAPGTSGFEGLPTPAAAFFIISLPVSIGELGILNHVAPDRLYGVVAIVISYLMISTYPLMSFKFTTYDWCSNKNRYLLIFVAVSLPLLLGYAGLPFVFLLYLIFSVIDNYSQPKCKT